MTAHPADNPEKALLILFRKGERLWHAHYPILISGGVGPFLFALGCDLALRALRRMGLMTGPGNADKEPVGHSLNVAPCHRSIWKELV